MKAQYDPLFTPWKIRDLEIKNRIVLAPMGGTCIFGWMEPLGSHFDYEAARLLMNIAKSDCGLVIPGIAPVKDMLGGKWLYQNKRKFKELKAFMDEFHKTGAKMFIQMTAGFGRSMALTAPLAMLAKNKVLNKLASPIIDAEPASSRKPASTALKFMQSMKATCLTSSHCPTPTTGPTNTADPSRTATASPSRSSTRSNQSAARTSPSRSATLSAP